MPFMPPAAVSSHLVAWIEPTALYQAFGEAQCHRRIIRPFTGLEPKWTTANHVGDRRKAATGGKLDGGSHRTKLIQHFCGEPGIRDRACRYFRIHSCLSKLLVGISRCSAGSEPVPFGEPS